MRTSHIVAVAVVAAVSFSACKRDAVKPIDASNPDTKNFSLWKKYETPAGADPSVPAELGGKGFEEIATKEGFVTYSPKGDELKYFGSDQAKTGGEIHSVVPRAMITLRTFGQNAGQTENRINESFVYETLLASHPVTREPIPALATHWKISEDKMTFTYRIDPNARFSDGKPVTAEDVVASWTIRMDPTINDPFEQQTWGKFDKPVAKSKYIVEVHSKNKNWRNFLYFSNSFAIFPAHEIGTLTGKEFLDKFQYDMPAGSGEYILLKKDFVKEQSWALTRRDDYWRKDYPTTKNLGNFDKISFEVVKDNPSLEYEKFKKGEQDYFRFSSVSNEKWVNDKYEQLEKNWILKKRIFNDGPMGRQYHAFNMRKPPFDDIRIRKAFAYMLNRESIITKVLLGEYEASNSYFPNSVYENPANEKVTFNPEKAIQLLAEAGWKEKNSDGILVKNGKPFVIEYAINKAVEQFVTPYQQELRKIGIDLQIKFQDQNTLFKNALERNFQLWQANWAVPDPPNPESSLKSDLADKQNNTNVEGFKSAKVDELLKQYDDEFDPKKRIPILRQIDSEVMATYAGVLQWYPKGIRFAHWNKFGYPEYVIGRFTQFGYLEGDLFQYWWYDGQKAANLEKAKKEKSALPAEGIEVRYWKNLPQVTE